MMLTELEGVLDAVPEHADRQAYIDAITEANCLSKATAATRRLTSQRLSELYALDPSVPMFRVLRLLAGVHPASRPQLALLSSLARDPMLAATAESVIHLKPGAEFQRTEMRAAVRLLVGGRLSDSTLDKVVRNAASTWAQSGHLLGRTFKVRKRVTPTAAAIAFALYLATAVGFAPDEALSSGWCKVLDCGASTARELALEAKRMGLIDLRAAGDVLELDLSRLDSAHRGVANG